MHGREDAADSARHTLVWHRTVGDQPVRLLGKSVPLDNEKDVLVPRRRTTMERCADQRLENVPDRLPALADWLAQRTWMLAAKHRPVRVVVDRHVLRSPPQEHRQPIR